MSCILKYFSFLCQLKGHKANNELVTTDFDLKFGYKKGFLAHSEALCMCPSWFNFIFFNSKLSSEKIKELLINFHTLTFDLDIFPNTSIWEISEPKEFFLGGVGALPQISPSQVECK